VPWRRSEVSAAGWALALLGPAYANVGCLGTVLLALHGDTLARYPLPSIVFAGIAVGVLGGLMRARWAAVGALLIAIVLPMAHFAFLSSPWPEFAVAELAAIAAAPLLWWTARSNVGSLRALAR
jgi:hypothetical protein